MHKEGKKLASFIREGPNTPCFTRAEKKASPQHIPRRTHADLPVSPPTTGTIKAISNARRPPVELRG